MSFDLKKINTLNSNFKFERRNSKEMSQFWKLNLRIMHGDSSPKQKKKEPPNTAK